MFLHIFFQRIPVAQNWWSILKKPELQTGVVGYGNLCRRELFFGRTKLTSGWSEPKVSPAHLWVEYRMPLKPPYQQVYKRTAVNNFSWIYNWDITALPAMKFQKIKMSFTFHFTAFFCGIQICLQIAHVQKVWLFYMARKNRPTNDPCLWFFPISHKSQNINGTRNCGDVFLHTRKLTWQWKNNLF